MLVRFPRGLDDDKAFINLISLCQIMDRIILTNHLPIDFISTIPIHSILAMLLVGVVGRPNYES